MTVDAFRLKNFMAFRDTGWIELRAITLLFGSNSSGKSAVIRSLRLLKQSLHRLQATPILRFAVEGQLDLGDFAVALHKRAAFEDYAEQVEGQKISFQFRGELLDKSIAILHAYINSWLEQKGLSRLDPPESQSDLRQIEFGLEYGQTYDQITNELVIQLVGVHIDCPWPILSSKLGRPEEPLNFLSASRVPPTHYKDGKLSLPEASSENYPGYMEWNREWFWESDFGLEQHVLAEASIWRDIVITAIEDFFPSLIVPSNSMNGSDYNQDNFLTYHLKEILSELNQSIKNFLEQIEYLGPIRPAPERTYMLKRADIERWQRMGLGAWLETLQKGAFAPPPIITKQDSQDQTASPMTKWLKELSLGEQLYVRRFADIPQSDLVAQIFIRNDNNQWINLSDVGYGASQVLPIIATCLTTQPGSLVIVEQPELHLHPKAQLQLARLFFYATERKIKLLLETHSEHFMLRLRSQIVTSTLEGLSTGDAMENPSRKVGEQLLIGFVSKDPICSNLTAISVNDTGDFINEPDEFREFFADDAIEIMKITRNALQVELLQGR